MEIQGEVAEGFEPVREAFVRNFEVLGDRGAAVAVYRDGRRVVDLWAGPKDADAPAGPAEPWTAGTAQVVRSATKGVAAAVPLLLHQRGLLDLAAPVGSYWPEFKAAGKERVLVRDLLAHRAAIPALDRSLTPAEALDGATGPRAVAAQRPFWEPGTAHGYHAQTYGWLLSELVLRVTGASLGQWLAREVTGPLGLDFWIGLPAAEAAAGRVGRVAAVAPPERPGTLRTRPRRNVSEAYADPASLTRRAFAAIDPLPDENAPAYRAAELPASAGTGTARALAGFYAALLDDTDDGARLFTPRTTALAGSELSAGPDRVLVVNTRFGPGYMLHGPASPLLSPASFGHPGRGGSLAFADPEAGIGFGYVTNALAPSVTADPRAQALVRAVRTAAAGVSRP
ncbi:serine hydrolase domain-containing protein [Streptomyces subrutilus]|uniref:Class A beta-lactamase-related serine hydrolase n=1 Tax=Streptomyces subrutilus TaxID=36818 RepID=A0A5P2UPM1_9ACTN|nr:serine hydrolase domain-containing protein [Streptomyces subrutilus]QEU80255.1 class A beta-lactamase-related serine hydrolase [Streptomyces subrutilus]WSJ30459.1 beta-lactamase family protein [Streptomyces subrutilus]GGZ49225.1 esterase [Streptomyces subrutilus]